MFVFYYFIYKLKIKKICFTVCFFLVLTLFVYKCVVNEHNFNSKCSTFFLNFFKNLY